MAEVLQPTSPPDGSPCFSSTPLRRHTPPPRPALVTDSTSLPKTLEADVERFRSQLDTDDESTEVSSISSSPRLDKASLNSTPPSCISFGKAEGNDAADDADDDLYFPSYDNDSRCNPPRQYSYYSTSKSTVYHDSYQEDDPPTSLTESSSTVESSLSSPGVKQIVDDTAVQEEPSRQVDYLSHDWREEDIWSSWRHIVSNRRLYGERSRLENASWRTWAKAKYQLKTISPETLNWLKDCDVTWLYGPLQESSIPTQRSATSTGLSKSNSFVNKKPILKKRSVSEVMLQKSISNSSLVRQAAAAVQAQQSRLNGNTQEQSQISRTPSDFFTSSIDTANYPNIYPSNSSSGLQSPENGRKHIRFHDTVEQCIAVDFDSSAVEDQTVRNAREPELSSDSYEEVEEEEEQEEDDAGVNDDDDDDDDEDVIILKTKSNRRPSSTSSSRRSSVGQESKGIVKLPSTTLKYYDNDPDCPGHDDDSFDSGYGGGRLISSSSQETLRPTNPATNFLIDDDDEADMSWEPAGPFARASNSNQEETSNGMRRTPSGMFMPFDDDEEEQGFASTGMLGRVVDTVNTARDIMHVIMNVGWRS